MSIVAPAIEEAHSVRESQRIPQLDGLRGLAIGMVLLYHHFGRPGLGSTGIYRTIAWTLHLGWAGVDLFFVLSGFLIGGILIDNQNSPNYYRTFYLRRAFRILPLYIILLLSYILALQTNFVPLMLKYRLPSWSYLVFAQNLMMVRYSHEYASGFRLFEFGASWMTATWSLAVEEQFYVILPLIVRRLSMRAVKHVAVAMILLAPVTRLFSFYIGGPRGFTAAYVLMPCRIDALGFGLLAAILWREKRIPRIRWLLAAIPFLVWGLCKYTVYSGMALKLSLSGYSVTAACGFVLLLLCLSCPRRSVLYELLVSRMMVTLGNTSYCLYLWHSVIAGILFHFVLGSGTEFKDIKSAGLEVASLTLSVAVSWLSWRYFESWLLAFARRFRYRADEEGLTAE